MNNKKMEIQKYNEDLASSNTVITILEYAKKLNDKFYNIDISFIDDFLELVDKDDYCIHHEMLVKYGASQMSSGSNDIKKIMEQNFFVEDEDYKKTCPPIGGVDDYPHKIEYFLKPDTFKKILIRSRNTDKYPDYYLLLEKALKYYINFGNLKCKIKSRSWKVH